MNGNGKRVLLVNDDAHADLLLATLLDQTGYNVLQAYNGVHALLELNKRRFDVVIAAYPMSSISGMELLNHIRARGLTTRVILVSDMLPTISAVDKGLQPFAWLRKPYRRGVLLDLVSEAAHVVAQISEAEAAAAASR